MPHRRHGARELTVQQDSSEIVAYIGMWTNGASKIAAVA